MFAYRFVSYGHRSSFVVAAAAAFSLGSKYLYTVTTVITKIKGKREVKQSVLISKGTIPAALSKLSEEHCTLLYIKREKGSETKRAYKQNKGIIPAALSKLSEEHCTLSYKGKGK